MGYKLAPVLRTHSSGLCISWGGCSVEMVVLGQALPLQVCVSQTISQGLPASRTMASTWAIR